jgi:two-component sensor histidine kinase
LGDRLPRADSTYSLKISAFRHAFDLYGQVNDDKGAIQVFSDWEMLEQSYHRKMSPDILLSVAAFYLYENYQAAYLHYTLTLRDTIRPADLSRWFSLNYLDCEAFFRIGFVGFNLPAARKCLDLAEQHGYPELYYIARLVVTGLIKEDSAQEALRLMQRITRDHSPRSALEDRAVAYSYGMIYDRLGRADTAEMYFLRVMRQDSGFVGQPKSSLFLSLFFQPAETAIAIGEFYVRRGKFREARSYLQQVVNDSLPGGQVSDRRVLELLLFRASQALGDYGAAMQYHRRYEDFNDSVIQSQMLQLMWAGVIKNISEVQKYRFDSSYLIQQIERAELKRAGIERKIILACSSILLLATAFLLWGYRMKKRNVVRLQQQQSVIHRQNRVQQQLIGEKDKLLEEKDLLMQEIHHRVKNNLNIIISLLESQSLYLNNEAARAALHDTQNRVHAVFLLHEKLYGSAVGPELNVHTYVLELINHLYESFDFHNQNIVINHTIEPIYLDAPDVLPLAVILNEAVTNSLKYAFPEGRKGEIHLTLRRLPCGSVQMQIRDNGVGFPAGYRPAFGDTLGFNLITGLANQLEGYCGIKNDGGVVITIQFRPRERRAFARPASNSA